MPATLLLPCRPSGPISQNGQVATVDNQGRIRTQALALIRRDDRILVERGHDWVKDEWFCRLLGGTVEFGEQAPETLRRELLEELGAETDVGRLVATIENIFTFGGAAGTRDLPRLRMHPARRAVLRARRVEAEEITPDGPMTHDVAWKPIDSFGSEGEILYPDELVPLLREPPNPATR